MISRTAPRPLSSLVALVVPTLFGCGGATPEPAPQPAPTASAMASATASATSAPTPAPVDPFAIPEGLAEEALPASAEPSVAAAPLPSPKGLAKAPASCDPFVKRKPGKGPACADRAAALTALAAALDATGDAADAALAALEGCEGLPKGLALALRAERAPIVCADGVVGAVAEKPTQGMSGHMHEALRGLALAARVARAGRGAPKLAPPFEKKKVEAFHKGAMVKWANEQSTAIDELSNEIVKLGGYGGAVGAVEAGAASLRVVEAVREVPLPEEIAKVDEAKNLFYGNLDALLEPRKVKGRDAALVGLGRLAKTGVLVDTRADAARALLSKLYGGRRIDALDRLVLPAATVAAPASLEERLAARLPTFYAGLVLLPEAATQPGVLARLAPMGLAPQHRAALKNAKLDDASRVVVARARLELARKYWRAVDVDEAVRALAGLGKRDELASALLALALGLRGGPTDAGTMMLKAPMLSLGLGDTRALDALAAGSGPHKALAAFDAAYLRELSPPEAAAPAHFKDVASRYRAAAAAATEPTLRDAADKAAKAADELAAALEGEKKK